MTQTHSEKTSTGRNRLLTIASITAVTLAGAFAVSANIGILDATESNAVGTLAAGDLAVPSTQVVDVRLDGFDAAQSTEAQTGADLRRAAEPSSPTTSPPPVPAVQEFAVDSAGTVGVVVNDGAVRLDLVDAAAGWTWKLLQEKPSALAVTLANGRRTLEFTATANADGTVDASVNEPIVRAAPTPPAPAKASVTRSTAPPASETYRDDESDDHQDHEDQESGEHEYEGGDDDD